ncbi:hypothetical protein M501DRAFT_532372 [Patellaria atrata CBS 101060]|uniref:Uncharacterized protein n=1 Tax=Patellaria atrata CBS 101060 TaxID=1346257 RepID=A0A9P4SEC2_9PEZI|nr:hypothetical protein M501DRAFT_532372 [Patellaria atrata CBS 101060]
MSFTGIRRVGVLAMGSFSCLQIKKAIQYDRIISDITVHCALPSRHICTFSKFNYLSGYHKLKKLTTHPIIQSIHLIKHIAALPPSSNAKASPSSSPPPPPYINLPSNLPINLPINLSINLSISLLLTHLPRAPQTSPKSSSH